MTGNIAPVSTAQAPDHPTHDARADKLRHAATEFETILVKQLLKAAKIGSSGGAGGEEKANGYADMAVDALASAIEKGGGLGLARRIEDAISTGSRVEPPAAGGAAPASPTGG